MQSQTTKVVLAIIIVAVIVGGGVYYWQQKQVPNSPPITNIQTNEWTKIVQYNCEQSNGIFSNDKCECPLEEQLGQTQEMMYDRNTGYCQTTVGGPGGAIMGQGLESYDRKVKLDACLEELATYKNK